MTFTKHSYHGLHIPFNGKYVTIMSAAMFKCRLTDKEIVQVAHGLIRYNQSLGRLSRREMKPRDFKIGPALTTNSLKSERIFTKYITRTDYESYYSKGIFQLGNSKYYRNIENQKSRDGFEGFNCTFLDVNAKHLPIIFFQCNNYLLLCGSYDDNSDYLTGQFGAVKMIIKDIDGFCNKLKTTLQATSFIHGSVIYSNARIYKSKPVAVIEPIDDLLRNYQLIRFAIDNAVLPSLFVKPEMFSNENEFRLAFEMPKDHDLPYRIENTDLLQYIEFVGV